MDAGKLTKFGSPSETSERVNLRRGSEPFDERLKLNDFALRPCVGNSEKVNVIIVWFPISNPCENCPPDGSAGRVGERTAINEERTGCVKPAMVRRDVEKNPYCAFFGWASIRNRG